MEYTQFRFKNFKGIAEMVLDVSGGVTTLIGLNESGKTTILEGIFCFSYGAENLDAIDPSMASLRDPELWIPISKRGNFNATIEIGATVRLNPRDQQDYRRKMKERFGLQLAYVPTVVNITEKYHFENSRHVVKPMSKIWDVSVRGIKGQQRTHRNYGADSVEWQGAVGILKDQLPSIWYFPNFLFELPDRFILEKAEDAQPSEERDKDEFYRLTFEEVLNQTGAGAKLGSHIVDRVKSEDRADQRNLRSLLLDMGRDITKTVFEGWNRTFGRPPVPQEVELDAATGEDGAAYLELKIKGPDGYYDLSERSLGFRWFFMFLLMTSYRGRSTGGRDAVFLLDEPASNLHSSAQAELLKSFETLAESYTLIYTTHSHHMINVKWLDSAYVVKNEALADFSLERYMSTNTAAHTSISARRYRQFVSENPDSRSYFQPVLDLLEYRPSDLEYVPHVVLVEGKSDFYLLKYFVDVLGVVPELKFVPGGGAGALDPLIRLHIGWAKGFVVLLDGDAEGARQKARYLKEFGVLLQDICLTLPELSGDAQVREVEDLVTPPDRDVMLNAVYAPGVVRPKGKKAFSNCVMELYARKEEVALSPQSLENVSAILSRLEGLLAS